MGRSYVDGWAPYVSVAQRQRQAQQKLAALNKKGQGCQPVAVQGRSIAKSFWGKAWCAIADVSGHWTELFAVPTGRSVRPKGIHKAADSPAAGMQPPDSWSE